MQFTNKDISRPKFFGTNFREEEFKPQVAARFTLKQP